MDRMSPGAFVPNPAATRTELILRQRGGKYISSKRMVVWQEADGSVWGGTPSGPESANPIGSRARMAKVEELRGEVAAAMAQATEAF